MIWRHLNKFSAGRGHERGAMPDWAKTVAVKKGIKQPEEPLLNSLIILVGNNPLLAEF
ncbi:hypothetical protein [Limosilactobacillus antri]|uniref:Uncharacterized protein n=1 Tax=Limosilactobacillus antri DSM 16041 TaxID=525309 RepID=C8P5U7_9LACO|nr:hypothetical protein [Limosilactobacillus antri]EEW54152.1 hypothetical protein HMPREF0494_0691 [Limosilactobacillus antri DSM 16041]